MPCICYPIEHLIIQATVKFSEGEDSLCAVATLRSLRLFFTSPSPIANKNRGFPSLLLNIKKPFYHKCRRMSISNSSPSHTDSNEDAGSSPIPFDYAEIVVIRHGETTWNSSGRIQGHLDAELNEVGRQQATAVADRLSKESKVSAVYSSDLKRALETAQIIAKSCNLNEVIQDPALRERHLGDLQGLVFRDAARLNPEAYRAFSSPKTNQEIPGGGESLDQLYQRMTSSLERIARKHKGERVIAVTHGGALRALFKRAAPKGLSQGKVMNTSVNIFHLSDSDDWIIKVWGDVSHLSKTGFLESGFGGDKNSG
ncbi:phosphoglycerate mutase-like protein 4 isoform X2 [Magnolia sinica]|uniref:phosphoglycerate mutase-like protein 4 isoform X2 n=1 Tax=Magnolia sinica TaxID=86752 RepID=UPI002659D3B1|nr:phosphoglycerate mutase-like protein 4 isoform X2 [Magnolia sinica]